MLVTIIYPAAPFEVIPGGIDTFIKGILDYAPSNIEFQMIGITTDPKRFEIGKTHQVQLDTGRTIEFIPILYEKNSERRSKIPLSLRFTLRLLRYKNKIKGSVLEFHRFEPCVAMWFDKRPKTLFVHQDMQALSNTKTDVRWSSFSGLFYSIEKFVLKRFSLIHCVKESTAHYYKESIHQIASRTFFTPTWYDPESFSFDPNVRQEERAALEKKFGFDREDKILVFVGRIDHQKDPKKLVESVKILRDKGEKVRLLVIGDGVLRKDVESSIKEKGLAQHILLLGLKPKAEIAKLLVASDLFVLPSRYEGMPIALLEALASGLPSIANNVGEVARIVNSFNGVIVEDTTSSGFAAGVAKGLKELILLDRESVAKSVKQFGPYETLKTVYGRYDALT